MARPRVTCLRGGLIYALYSDVRSMRKRAPLTAPYTDRHLFTNSVRGADHEHQDGGQPAQTRPYSTLGTTDRGEVDCY